MTHNVRTFKQELYTGTNIQFHYRKNCGTFMPVFFNTIFQNNVLSKNQKFNYVLFERTHQKKI